MAIEAANIALYFGNRVVSKVTVEARHGLVQRFDESIFAATLLGFRLKSLDDAASKSLTTKFFGYPQVAYEQSPVLCPPGSACDNAVCIAHQAEDLLGVAIVRLRSSVGEDPVRDNL